MIEWCFSPFQFLEWIIRVMFFGETVSEDIYVDDYIAAFIGTFFAFFLFVMVLHKLKIIPAIYRCCCRIYRIASYLLYPDNDLMLPPTLSDSQLAIVVGRQMIWDAVHGGDGDGTVCVEEELFPQIEEQEDPENIP